MPSNAKRLERKAEGLCVYCGAPLGTNSTVYCDTCNEVRNQREQFRYDYFIEEGLCSRCREPLDRVGCCCSKCNEHIQAQKRERKARLLEQGLCSRCGKEPVILGLKYGKLCQEKVAKRYARKI